MLNKILFLSIVLFIFIGCSSEDKKELKTIQAKSTTIEPKKVVNSEIKAVKQEDIKKKVLKPIEPKVQTVKQEIPKIEKNSKLLYAKCQACHGAKGEKKALGVSKIISAMSKDEIVSSLLGYKNGTYGGKMAGVMKGQVANLTKKDFELIAKYIKK